MDREVVEILRVALCHYWQLQPEEATTERLDVAARLDAEMVALALVATAKEAPIVIQGDGMVGRLEEFGTAAGYDVDDNLVGQRVTLYYIRTIRSPEEAKHDT